MRFRLKFPEASTATGPEAAPFRFSRRNCTVARHLVDAMYCGARMDAADRTEIAAALRLEGTRFLEHPLWTEVSDAQPHLAVLRRTADVCGVDWNTVWVPCGYSDGEHFVREVSRWYHWYARCRTNFDLRDGRAAKRVEKLCGVLSGELECDPAGDRMQATERELSVSATESDGGLAGARATASGASDTEAVRHAMTTVSDDVVVEGLINNQRLASTPKGTVTLDSMLVISQDQATVKCFALQEPVRTRPSIGSSER